MHVLNWLFGGIVGGAVGAAAWVAIEYTTQSEFAWMAWPVGLLVGWGVHKFAAADTRGGFLRGALAALLALAAVLGAGWSKAEILTKQAARASNAAVGVTVSETDGSGEGEVAAAIDRVSIDIEEPAAGFLNGPLESKPRNAFQDLNMLWLCLAALTAYVVGKGSGTGVASSEELAKEEEPPAGEPASEAGDNA